MYNVQDRSSLEVKDNCIESIRLRYVLKSYQKEEITTVAET
jgi:hypothetical protein